MPACGNNVRKAVDQIARVGISPEGKKTGGIVGVQLSAALKGIRPRELDTSARKDLRALMVRRGMMVSGIDLLIPDEDWVDSGKVDRALSAVNAAHVLAGDMGRVPLVINLPVGEVAEEIKEELVALADGRSVPLVVQVGEQAAELLAWVKQVDHPMVGVAVDPARQLQMKKNVVGTVSEFGDYLMVGRADDVGSDGMRCTLGNGRLDVLAYQVSLSQCSKLKSVVMELRELSDPIASMHDGHGAWNQMP